LFQHDKKLLTDVYHSGNLIEYSLFIAVPLRHPMRKVF
jgi:hypothetical protein